VRGRFLPTGLAKNEEEKTRPSERGKTEKILNVVRGGEGNQDGHAVPLKKKQGLKPQQQQRY